MDLQQSGLEPDISRTAQLSVLVRKGHAALQGVHAPCTHAAVRPGARRGNVQRVISACEMAKQPHKALELLAGMLQTRLSQT